MHKTKAEQVDETLMSLGRAGLRLKPSASSTPSRRPSTWRSTRRSPKRRWGGFGRLEPVFSGIGGIGRAGVELRSSWVDAVFRRVMFYARHFSAFLKETQKMANIVYEFQSLMFF